MPTYTYRREDGTTFDIRQKFSDDALQVDPETGQKVTRVIQSAGVIFKGSGFYVTDNRSANNPAAPKASEGTSTNGGDTSSKSTTSDSPKKSEKSSSPAASE